MPENLVQHRGQPSVWDDASRGRAPRWMDAGRVGAIAAAGALLLAAIRGRSPGARALCAASGVGFAWWAVSPREARRQQLTRVREACGRARGQADVVTEAAEESFPASDAPAFTPGTRRGGWANGSRRLWPLRW